MAKATLKVSVRFRWWVMPLVYAAIVPAAFVGFFGGGESGQRFVNRVGNFVLRYGMRAE